MTGALWAVSAGLGFGVFQSLNRRAVHGMDVYLATLLQLLISALVLVIVSFFTIDLSLLRTASVGALINFALAGFFHFSVGWTLLNTSQKRIGAARTSPLIASTPLFGAVIAALTLREFPNWLSWVGIVLMVLGVYLISSHSDASSITGSPSQGEAAGTAGWRASLFGLAAALCWSISPIFIRQGLRDLPSPLLGVTIGTIASGAAYGAPLLLRRGQRLLTSASTDALLFRFMAGVLVGLSTWMRWIALDLTAVATVLALSLVSVPVVMLLSPLVMGKQLERVTPTLMAGAGLIVCGALLLILIP